MHNLYGLGNFLKTKTVSRFHNSHQFSDIRAWRKPNILIYLDVFLNLLISYFFLFRCLDSAYQIAKRIEQSAGEMTLKKDSRLADGLDRIEKAHRRFCKVIDEIDEEEDCSNQQNSIYLGR